MVIQNDTACKEKSEDSIPYGKEKDEYQNHPENFGSSLIGIDEQEFDYLNNSLEHPINKGDFRSGKACIVYRNGLDLADADIIGKNVTCALYEDQQTTKTFTIEGITDENYYTALLGYPPTIIACDQVVKTFANHPITLKTSIKYHKEYDRDTEQEILALLEENDNAKDFSWEPKIEDADEIEKAQGNMPQLGISLLVCTMVPVLTWIVLEKNGTVVERIKGVIGKVGNDMFGAMLKETIERVGISSKELKVDKNVNTTLAFVHTFPDGDRAFSFYRNPGADMVLTEDEVDDTFVQSTKIFHFGTLSMTHENVRNATKKAVKAAKKNGSLISFDPNLREPLWESLEEAKKQMEYGFEQCDILKISDNEIQFITGIEDYDQGVLYLQNKYEIPLILLTMGKKGSRAYYKDFRIEEKGFQVSTIETTGAGDTFCGCSLAYILEHDINNLTEDHLREMLIFANAGAALVTTKKGAICSMPERREIVDLIDVSRNAIHQF